MKRKVSAARRFSGQVRSLLGVLALLASAEAGATSVQSGASGLSVTAVECRNLTAGSRVRFSTAADEWDCADAGFVADSGDSVSVTVRGRSDARVPLLLAHPFAGGVNGPLVGADFEPDGDTDIVQKNAFGWWEHDGNDPVGFSFHALDGLELFPSAFTAADIDGNDKPDIVAGFAGNSQKLVWYKNVGGSPVGFVVKPIESRSGWRHEGVAAGDLDGDGDEDLAAVLSETGGLPVDEELVWIENDSGGGSFSRWVLDAGRATDGFSGAVAVADMDGDGDKDIVFGDLGDRVIRWFENDGGVDPTFTSRIVGTSVRADRFDVVDLDADGDLDVAPSLSIVDDYELRLYESIGGSPTSFIAHSLGFFPDRMSSRSIVSDLTEDGVPDVIMPANTTSMIPLIWLERSIESFTAYTEHQLPHLENFPGDMIAADIDGKGRIDIVSAREATPDFVTLWYEVRGVVGGWIHSVTPSKVRCRNLTSGQTVQSSLGEDSWDCQELGLSVAEGDRVEMTVLGIVE